MGRTQSLEIAQRAVGKINRIDADWLRELDEAMLGFFAIDQPDDGIDERELSWYADLPAKNGTGLRARLLSVRD